MSITVNNALRLRMKRGGVYYWMVAKELGIAESTLIRWLRTDLTGDRKKQVNEAVDRLIDKGKQHDSTKEG